MQKEQEEQRAGRNKATTINSGYIESGSFRRKFDRISDDTDYKIKSGFADYSFTSDGISTKH